jgi:hypothetical protein
MDKWQRKLAQQRNWRVQKRIFNTFKKQQQAQLCHCKCGGYAKPGNKFINEHYRPKGKNNPSYGKSYNKGIPIKKWRSFEEAREYACSLGLKRKAWINHCKFVKKPNDIPDTPNKVYKGKGWTGWTDFLGYIPRQMKPGSALSYEEAKKIIQRLNIPSQKTFHQLSKQKKLPKGIPGNPRKKYKGKGWIDGADFLGFEDQGWTVRRIKELWRGLMESNVISEWTSKKDEIVLYRILHTKGLLNLQDSNRHFEFFKNLPEATHVTGALKEIKEYAYSDDYSNEGTPPDLTKYTGIHSNQEDENENIGTASTDELAELVSTDNKRKDPLDYDSHDTIETPTEILKSIDRIESIIVDDELMRLLLFF